jgi:hypothetical protein
MCSWVHDVFVCKSVRRIRVLNMLEMYSLHGRKCQLIVDTVVVCLGALSESRTIRPT